MEYSKEGRWGRQNKMRMIAFASLLVLVGADAWVHKNSGSPSRHFQQHVLSMTTVDSNFNTLPRLYVGPSTRLSNDMRVCLTPDQAHYVTKVMRLGKRATRVDCIRVFGGINGEWLAEIQIDKAQSGKKRRRNEGVNVTAHCTRQLRPQCIATTSPLTEPWLLFAPIKKQRIKLMLEKCTELGVGRFVPILTERTEASSVRGLVRDLDKLALQTIEASEQCERLTVPPLSITCMLSSNDGCSDEPWNLAELLKAWSTEDELQNRHLLICREREAECSVPVLRLLQTLHELDSVTGIAFVVGPEGGWSPQEEALCDQYARDSQNIHCVSLGSLVLRAETAAIAAISACMMYNDLYNGDVITISKS